MTILLPTLAVAFAAFCVWLTVRIVNRRERWAKWTAVGLAVGLPSLYVLSIGPVCWFGTPHGIYVSGPGKSRFTNSDDRAIVLPDFYFPIGWLARQSDFVRGAINRFGHAGGSTMPIIVPTCPDGRMTIVLEVSLRP